MLLALASALIVAACGVVAADDTDPAAADPHPPHATSEPSGGEGRNPVDRQLARAAADSAMAGALRGAADRVGRGAAAVDSRTAGAIVAHVRTERIVARRRPAESALPVGEFAATSQWGGPTVFLAVDHPVDGWLEVLLPVRPNGTTGWVQLDDVELSINPYRIEIDTAAYELTVFRYGEVAMTTTVAIGDGDTPTPIGDFYLVELLRPSDPEGIYGPYAYGLSGYSDTLATFNGGEGVIGIHGTNRPDLLGQNVSHGCVRVANPTIEEMTRFLPLGTPVSISA